MFDVYILSSQSRNYIYVGISSNLKRRLEEHQNGNNSTTKPYRPFQLIYTEKFQTRIEARNREKYLKSGSGKEWIKKYCERGGTCLPAGRLVDAHV